MPNPAKVFALVCALAVSACAPNAGSDDATATLPIATAGGVAPAAVSGAPSTAISTAGVGSTAAISGVGAPVGTAPTPPSAAGASALAGAFAPEAGRSGFGVRGAGRSAAGVSGAAGTGTAAGPPLFPSAGQGGAAGPAQDPDPAPGSCTSAAGTGGSAGSTCPGPMRTGKFVGNITTSGQVRSDFAMYWDQITPENEGKWGSVEAVRNNMNWAGLDRVHDYAKAHGIVFKQHTLLWGSQQPSWLAGLSAEQQKAEVEEWIRLFCERYPDVALIDVVNEPPPHTMPVYMNALGGAGSSGYDWIVQGFKWARQYCPNAILILNDYNNIEYSGDNSHFVDIVTRIKNAGAPIDALGAQAHDAYKIAPGTLQGYLDKLAATGLPIYITEFDINVASDAEQQSAMQSQFTLFWNDPHIQGITLWGYIEGATWRPNTGLMSSAGVKRPAMTWLMNFLGR